MKKYKTGDKIIIKSHEDNYLLLRTVFYIYNSACNHLKNYVDKAMLQYATDKRAEVFDTIDQFYPALKKHKYVVHTNVNNPTSDFVIMIYGGQK